MEPGNLSKTNRRKRARVARASAAPVPALNRRIAGLFLDGRFSPFSSFFLRSRESRRSADSASASPKACVLTHLARSRASACQSGAFNPPSDSDTRASTIGIAAFRARCETLLALGVSVPKLYNTETVNALDGGSRGRAHRRRLVDRKRQYCLRKYVSRENEIFVPVHYPICSNFDDTIRGRACARRRHGGITRLRVIIVSADAYRFTGAVPREKASGAARVSKFSRKSSA